MGLSRLIYVSQPFGFDDFTLNRILRDSRRNNEKHDVTGALIYRADIYLQLLEGPDGAVKSTYAKIAADDRHLDVRLLLDEHADQRLFPAWAMRDDPARSWMWTQSQVAAGAMTKADRAEIVAVFERLKAEAA